MRVGILGSGMVGQTIGAKLAEVGEDVVLGTRSPKNTSDKRGMGAPWPTGRQRLARRDGSAPSPKRRPTARS